MTCDAALNRMLEAEPAVLRGEGENELARHIAGCERCARVAEAILAELDSVDRALDDFAAARAPGAAADAALAAIRTQGDGTVVPTPSGEEETPGPTGTLLRRAGPVPPGRPPAGARRRSWTRTAWAPLAAAAALATVLVLARDESPVPTGTASASPAFRPRVSVTPPADRSAAILETTNPNITIVWLYEREES